MKRSLLLIIFLILFPPLNADTFDEIEAKRECDKWVLEGGTYLLWKKDWKQVDGGIQKKWKIKKKNLDTLFKYIKFYLVISKYT